MELVIQSHHRGGICDSFLTGSFRARTLFIHHFHIEDGREEAAVRSDVCSNEAVTATGQNRL